MKLGTSGRHVVMRVAIAEKVSKVRVRGRAQSETKCTFAAEAYICGVAVCTKFKANYANK